MTFEEAKSAPLLSILVPSLYHTLTEPNITSPSEIVETVTSTSYSNLS